MICDSCKTDRLINDFINNQNICYRCVYRQKLTKIIENQTEKIIFCRTCNKQIITKQNQKKRQRTVFCSCECAQKGHKRQLNNHWTRKIGQGEKKSGKSIINRPNSKDGGCNL